MQARKDEAKRYGPPMALLVPLVLPSPIDHSILFLGCIINVSSLMATKGGLGATAYAASKAGVIGKKASCHRLCISFFILTYIVLHTFHMVGSS